MDAPQRDVTTTKPMNKDRETEETRLPQSQSVTDVSIVNTMRDMQRTQRLTLKALGELNLNISDLKSSVEANGIGANPPALADISIGDESNSDDGGLDRKQIRLDGLEVYAVVAALTAGTLAAVFDSHQPRDIVILYAESKYFEMFLSGTFLVIGAIGIVSGLHCVFIFSLVTMYGRTAMGMDRDDALEIFFAGTGLQRLRGFNSFVWSLYSLMSILIVVIAEKVSGNMFVQTITVLICGRLMFYVYEDTRVILEKANVIFAPPAAPPATRPLDKKLHSVNEGSERSVPDGSNLRDSFRRGKSSFHVGANALLKQKR